MWSCSRGERIVRFAVTWNAPTWNAGGYNWANAVHTFTHMYVKHYPSALAAAETLAKNHDSLLKRILAWQQVVYTDENLPVWLRDSLVNILYMITEDGMWAQKRPPLPDWVREDDGLYGMIECPRGCPQFECIPCSFYGNAPLVYFFPELALSTYRGYKGFQFADGSAAVDLWWLHRQHPPGRFSERHSRLPIRHQWHFTRRYAGSLLFMSRHAG